VHIWKISSRITLLDGERVASGNATVESEWRLNDFIVYNILHVESTCTPLRLCCIWIISNHLPESPSLRVQFSSCTLCWSWCSWSFNLFVSGYVKGLPLCGLLFLYIYIFFLELFRPFAQSRTNFWGKWCYLFHPPHFWRAHLYLYYSSPCWIRLEALFLEWADFVQKSIFHLDETYPAARKPQEVSHRRVVGTLLFTFFCMTSALPVLDVSAPLPFSRLCKIQSTLRMYPANICTAIRQRQLWPNYHIFRPWNENCYPVILSELTIETRKWQGWRGHLSKTFSWTWKHSGFFFCSTVYRVKPWFPRAGCFLCRQNANVGKIIKFCFKRLRRETFPTLCKYVGTSYI